MIKLHKKSTASFDIDAQYSFTPVCPEELPVEGGTEIVDELNRQSSLASIRVGSKDAHSPKAIWVATDDRPVFSRVKGNNVDIAWTLHAVPGTKGFELIDGLPAPDEYDYFIWKGVEPDMHPYGACYHDLDNKLSTGVIEYFQMQGIDTVIVGGLATDYCVKTTVLQLLDAGFNIIVNLSACRGIASKSIEASMLEMKKAGAKLIQNCDEMRVAQ